MINFIDDNRYRWGVEPICRLLPIAPSTYYTTRKAHPSKRSQLDEYLKADLERVWEENYRVYGADKVWAQLNREQLELGGEPVRVARCTVERLMRELGI